MWICPVCDAKSEIPLCPNCGFDISCDCEHYPTLTFYPSALKAISQLRKERESHQAECLLCPACGGASFHLFFRDMSYQCDRCGERIGRELVQEQHVKYIHRSRMPHSQENDMLRHFRIIDKSSANPVSAICTGGAHSVLLLKDGSVLAAGSNRFGQRDVDQWQNIASIVAGHNCTAGIRKDGRISLIGFPYYGNAKKWENIQTVDFGADHIVGLRKDGRVIADGSNHAGQCNTEEWTDVIRVCAGTAFTAALRKDGTLYTAGRQLLHAQFMNITAIDAGLNHILMLHKDGYVDARGSNSQGQCDTSGWIDISAVSAGDLHSVALKKDGTVVAVGDNTYGQCDVSDWRNVVAISAGGSHTIGLCADGTLLAAGNNKFNQCDIAKLIQK